MPGPAGRLDLELDRVSRELLDRVETELARPGSAGRTVKLGGVTLAGRLVEALLRLVLSRTCREARTSPEEALYISGCRTEIDQATTADVAKALAAMAASVPAQHRSVRVIIKDLSGPSRTSAIRYFRAVRNVGVHRADTDARKPFLELQRMLRTYRVDAGFDRPGSSAGVGVK